MSNLGNTGLEGPLVFVDIETNGLNHIRGRAIEVAAIRVEQGKVVARFSSLLDPEAQLPQFITRLTGITENDLVGAPTFDQIADELKAVLDGALFVAHNVRFDYSFLKQEFARVGQTFLPKQLCTVKLSRSLYPHEKGHKLEDLIRRHNFQFAKRHRAYDDAAVLWQFLQYVSKHFPPEQIASAVSQQVKQPSIPKYLEPQIVRNLPEAPGVYIFEDDDGRPLYVGKSINIKQRVLSHFGRDHADGKEFKIAQTIKHIRTEQTSGELTALIRESQLVKELQPLYNRRLRRLNNLLLVKQSLNDAGYQTLHIEEAKAITPEDFGSVLAVYPRRSKARQALEQVAKDFGLCPKLLGLEKASGACFWYQLGKCKGACAGHEAAFSYNTRLELAFERQRIQSWPYHGPVLVEEKNGPETKQAIIVDQWCIVGELTQEAYCEPVLESHEQAFDLDTYKILQSFIISKSSRLSIKQLSRDYLQTMASAVA